MIVSDSRGHEIYWNGTEWLYKDDNTSISVERPCKRCGKMPTSEGYDACLGYIEGATAACCGHGTHEKYIKY